jgi:hypothetical protein
MIPPFSRATFTFPFPDIIRRAPDSQSAAPSCASRLLIAVVLFAGGFANGTQRFDNARSYVQTHKDGCDVATSLAYAVSSLIATWCR